MRADGHLGGYVEFDGQFVTIGHRGVARLVAGGGVKRVHVSQIGAVQIKPAGRLVNGFIQFAISGSPELRSRVGRQTTEAGRDENSVVFTRKQQAVFETMRNAIEYAQAALNAPPAPPPVDVAGQLDQLWQLFQKGALTAQEYEQQKAQLLGQPSSYPPPGQVSRGTAPGAPQHPHGWR